MVSTGRNWRRHAAPLVALTMALAIAGCSTPSPGNAPVEKSDARGPGNYVVQPGDTLYRIASKTGRRMQDISRWNGIDDPDKLEVGQVLRIVPPGGASEPPPRTAAGGEREPSKRPVPPAPRESGPPPSRVGTGDWAWPAQGQVIAGFNGGSNKGVDIAGKLGEPVVAATKGVVTVSETLRGYGNVLMIDHGSSRMTVYTHLRTALVKKGQTVQKGQQIAEMGNTDADRVKLHFEVRVGGRAVDPRSFLADGR